jgi:hypothetical protein
MSVCGLVARATDPFEGFPAMGASLKFRESESFGVMIAAEIPRSAEAVRAAGLRLD